jgi:hypothetical protein
MVIRFLIEKGAPAAIWRELRRPSNAGYQVRARVSAQQTGSG